MKGADVDHIHNAWLLSQPQARQAPLPAGYFYIPVPSSPEMAFQAKHHCYLGQCNAICNMMCGHFVVLNFDL